MSQPTGPNGFPPPGSPQPGSPQPGSPQPSSPQPGSPQPGSPQPGSPQSGFPPPGTAGAPNANPYAAPAYGSGQPAGFPFPPPGYPVAPTPVDPAMRMVVPIGVTPWAIASGYLGLVSFICGGLTGPLAIITGVMALRAIHANPSTGGIVRAWVGIVLGALGTIMLLFVIAALALG